MLIDILDFISTRPETVWMLALIGAVCVIGVVDYLRCFFEGKKHAIRWVVLFLSLVVAFILSPLVPGVITTIVILWLLILSIATIAKKTIIDWLQTMTGNIMSGANKGGKDGK
jgi:hypothetical protein